GLRERVEDRPDAAIVVAMPVTDDNVFHRLVGERSDLSKHLLALRGEAAAVENEYTVVANDNDVVRDDGISHRVRTLTDPDAAGELGPREIKEIAARLRCRLRRERQHRRDDER